MMFHNLPLALLAALPFVWAAPYCSLTPPQSSLSSAAAGGSGSDGSSPSSSSSSGSPSTGGNSSSDVVAMSWYAGWHSQYLPINSVSWSKYSAVSYAFATTTPDVGTVSLLASDEALLPQFVEAAHQNNVKAILTIGGWTGSQYFSTAVGSATNRTTFAQTVLNLVSTYDLDGIDFDWEYPNRQGLGCNILNADDSTNFLSFLQVLRQTPGGSNITVSAAASVTPFAGSDGSAMTNVSAFASVLDYVEIMNYDIWGSWSTAVGPNAPLNDSCSQYQEGSAVSAVAAWTTAGFPADQLVLGVPAYGHSFKVASSAALVGGALAAYPAFDKSDQPQGDSWDVYAPAGTDQCGQPTAAGYDGIEDFWGLMTEGWLDASGNPLQGIDYRYDNCSQTPYVYNSTSQVMVSFDNPQSFAAKGQYIFDAGLRGFAIWETAGDYNDMLLDAITGAIGVEEVGC